MRGALVHGALSLAVGGVLGVTLPLGPQLADNAAFGAIFAAAARSRRAIAER